MKIAIHDYFTHSGETAVANNLVIAANSLGIEVQRLTHAQDIEAFQPDFVICGPQIPKLTRYPTYSFLPASSSHALKSPNPEYLLTFDGYIIPPFVKKDCFRDLAFSAQKVKPGESAIGHPILSFTTKVADLSRAKVMYCGQNWDKRQLKLIEMLSQHDWFEVYGPESGWKESKAKVNYKGELSYEGTALVEKYRECGIGLDLMYSSHLEHNIPTNRTFEASAAEAIVISPRMEFYEKYYKDSVLYYDSAQDTNLIYEQIVQHVNWIHNHPDQARVLAKQAQKITHEQFSSERTLKNFIAYHEANLKQNQHILGSFNEQPEVAVIIRVGGRSLDILARCLDSLKQQIYQNIRPVLVLNKEVDGLEEFLVPYRGDFNKIDVLKGMERPRSTTLWLGLNHVHQQNIPYFGILDEADIYFPHHILHLLQAIRRNPNNAWAYALAITEYQDKKFEYWHIQENRTVTHYPLLNSNPAKEVTQLNTSGILIKTVLLDETILEDPLMHTHEDRYLWQQLFLKSLPIPVSRCTSLIYRGSKNEKEMFDYWKPYDLFKLKTRFIGQRRSNGSLFVTDLRMPETHLEQLIRLLKTFKKWICKIPKIFRGLRGRVPVLLKSLQVLLKK